MLVNKTYKDYKKSHIEWLGDVPSHWLIDRAKWSVQDCQNGVWGSEPEDIDDTVCIRVADFDRKSKTVALDKLTLRNITPKDRNARLLKNGDLLLEKSGGGDKQLVGAVVSFNHNFPAVTSNFVAKMSVHNNCNGRFLTYVHSHLYDGFVNYRSIKQTTGIQNLDSQQYLDERIPYPPFEEQQKIAKFLDYKTAQIDVLITKKEDLLLKLQEKRSALITQAVTKGINPNAPMKPSGIKWLGDVPAHWEIKKLKFCLKINNGRDYKEVQAESGYPVYGSGGQFTYASEFLHSGEAVLLGRKGTIDKPLYVNEAFWTVDTMYFGVPFPEYLGKYLFYCATFIPFSLYSTDTALPSMTQTSLNNHKIAIPSIDEQQSIVEFIESKSKFIDKQISKVIDVVSKLNEYRAALITNAVTGKIDVRNLVLPVKG